MRYFLPSLLLGGLVTLSCLTLAAIAPELVWKQVFFVVLGAIVIFTAASIPFHTWIAHRWWLYGLSILLLLLPFVLGHSSRNTARWIELGFVNIQPSQLALPLVALTVVTLVASPGGSWQKNIKVGLVLLPILSIVFVSPDLGTTLLLALSLGSALWFGRVSMTSLAVIAGIALLLGSLSWQLLLKPYQRERMVAFLQGSTAENNMHYNALQAHIAVGNGWLLGEGWGKGSQAQLGFLPENHTDFWFASFSEQGGFIASMALLAVYGLLIIWLITQSNADIPMAAQLYLSTVAVTLTIQVFVNIGMNIGLLPITGVTLPFASYGGSSLLSLALLFGIAFSAARSTTHPKDPHSWYNLPSGLVHYKEPL